MNAKEIKRLGEIEKRVDEIFKENGLETTNINFEIVTAERMIEAMAYSLPTNFSHWSFGRNFERENTQYQHSGHGIPYEVVWNFDNPTALLVDTNPFALNVLILAHVYGHVDFHLANMLMRKSRSIADITIEARSAKKRFLEYEKKYGVEEVEKVIDAAIAFQYHQDSDPFSDALPEEEIRERYLSAEMENLNRYQKALDATTDNDEAEKLKKDIEETEKLIQFYEQHTPPVPEYDILKYMIEKSPKMKKSWVKDVVTVVREQMRALAPNFRTRLLNEGWATFWHVRVLRQLAKEKIITPAEHEEAIQFHAQVTQKRRLGFNVYSIGPAFWEMIEDRWDKGRFGDEWEKCRDQEEKRNWDKKLGLGRKKIIGLRKMLSDRMAIESYFYDEFIRDEQMYLWQTEIDPMTGEEVYSIAEDRPEVIREILIRQHTTFGIPAVAVVDGNLNDLGHLLIKHSFSGFELDPKYENGALEKLYFFWERPIHLITYEIKGYDEEKHTFSLKEILHTYNGARHEIIDLG
ncbi:MAG: SpoVR family protein [Parcubacteria group bacterium GW2011_GWF2_38_76]|nr:MAG: SpoVR family protein [Parcubacteria group bacterium GW2011_GWF2_38_76]HBM45963.1 hypothetical protein [Patescibacteria group bacterium]